MEKEHVELKKERPRFDEAFAKRIMKANEESQCLVIKGVSKQNKKIAKEDIKSYMEKQRLESFFITDIHNVPYYFITANKYIDVKQIDQTWELHFVKLNNDKK